jgi:hypothetical protein
MGVKSPRWGWDPAIRGGRGVESVARRPMATMAPMQAAGYGDSPPVACGDPDKEVVRANRTAPSLGGRHLHGGMKSGILIRPYRAGPLFLSIPRALPWAGVKSPRWGWGSGGGGRGRDRGHVFCRGRHLRRDGGGEFNSPLQGWSAFSVHTPGRCPGLGLSRPVGAAI